MSFKNIVVSALIVGAITGVVYGLFQQLAVSPLIYAAEEFEVTEPSPEVNLTDANNSASQTSESDGHTHDHGHEAWSPEDGIQRIVSTVGANILIAIAYALVMIAAMAVHNHKSRKQPVSWKSGIVWGLGLLLAVYISPALLGLHPEVPGTVAAELADRQIWWITCAVSTLLGLALLYYAGKWLKLGGVALIAAPHIIGAPMPENHGFANSDPAAVAALHQLTEQFVLMTSIGMLIFFILLGLLSGIANSRFQRT